MRKNIRVIAIVCLLLILGSFLNPIEVHAVGEWCDVFIMQKEVDHDSGCTICTCQLIFQNSGTLKPEWQFQGIVNSTSFSNGTKSYSDFNNTTTSAGLNNGDYCYIEHFQDASNLLCIDGITWTFGMDLEGSDTALATGSTRIVGGLNGTRFDAMTDEQVRTALKAFWNAGYFVILGIYYKGSSVENNQWNGTDGYWAQHWVMLAGVDDNGVYIDDPIYDHVVRMEDCVAYQVKYKLKYIVPVKCNKTSPLEISGGQKLQVTHQDSQNAAALGLSSSFITGQMASSQWASSLMLAEADFSGIIPTGVENLAQTDRESLAAWQMNVESDKLSLTDIIRTLVVFVGIIFTLWGILIYLAYWFDHINTIFYVDVLHLVTFGQLHICPPGEKPTFHMGKEKKDRTVSHKQILVISGMCVLFGVLLISGTFYTIVQKFVRLITSFLS